MCDVTNSCVMWLIHVWHDSFMCDMTHSCVISLTHVWYHLFIWDMTHSYLSRTQVYIIHMCDITYSVAWHDAFMCVASKNRMKPHSANTWGWNLATHLSRTQVCIFECITPQICHELTYIYLNESRHTLIHGDEISPHICHELKYRYLNVHATHLWRTHVYIFEWITSLANTWGPADRSKDAALQTKK